MHFVSGNGIVLHYRLSGPAKRPVLVFANSLGTDLRLWDGMMGAFERDFRVLRYDKRGHGLSEAPAAPYTIDDHVGDLAALLERLDIAQAIVCGISVGGMIAQGLAAARPELARGLVLCDTAVRIGTRELWDERIAAIRAGGIEALADAILERWLSPRFRAQYAVEAAGWRNMLVRTPVEGYIGTCAAIRDADLSEGVRRIRRPVLCIAGSEDGATPPELVRATADLIDGARFAQIDGAGHLPCIEEPAVLAAMMRSFLEEEDLA